VDGRAPSGSRAGHRIGDAAPDGRTVVIVLRGELVGARGAFLERGAKFFNFETLSA